MKIYLTAVAASVGAAVVITSVCALRDGGHNTTPVHITMFH